MNMGLDLDGPRFGPAQAQDGRPKELVILLHGLGADGNDLISLAPLFARVLPEAAFVSPNAPYPCDMAPMGRQWFSFQDRDPSAVLTGVRAAASHLDAFIDAELERAGLPDARLVLIGFSQGTMMALHTAIRRAQPCAAVIGYSGALVGPELLAEEVRSRPPVLLVHGQADEVVPFPSMAAAEQALRDAGILVHGEARPGLGHGIDEEGLQLGAAMLKQSLYPDEAGPEGAGQEIPTP
ncbi:MAG: alpha/beta hydrolase [Alphaproteobacteria bacterium]